MCNCLTHPKGPALRFQSNPLLGRKQFVLDIIHPGMANAGYQGRQTPDATGGAPRFWHTLSQPLICGLGVVGLGVG